MKLLRVEREIAWYNISGKDKVDQLNIDLVSIEVLKKIVKENDDDPLLYDGYILNKEQIDRINSFLSNKIKANYDLFYYVLECSGIYDFNLKKQK